jgi:hypothetical protein
MIETKDFRTPADELADLSKSGRLTPSTVSRGKPPGQK